VGGYGGMGMMGAQAGAKSKKKSWGDQRSTEPIKSSAHERGPIRDFSPKNLPDTASPSSYHKGGTVRKSGVAKVKKGEEVLTPKEAREYRKLHGKRIAEKNRGLSARKHHQTKSRKLKRVQSK